MRFECFSFKSRINYSTVFILTISCFKCLLNLTLCVLNYIEIATMSSPDEEALRKMPYSELKKHAMKHGIRKSMKAEKIIASILSKKEADEDSFVTLERKIINSCKKNKELLFEEDKKAVSDTPRRETYTVDDPLTDIETINTSIVTTSASPELKKLDMSNILNEKVETESAKKTRKSKRKVSFVTPLRRSARFFSATPQYNSLKARPKTPIPNRSSSSKRPSTRGNKNVAGSLNLDSSVDDVKTSGGIVKRPSTPMPIAKQKRKRLSSLGHSDDAMSPHLKPVTEIAPILQELTEETSDETPKSFYATPIASSNVKQDKANFSKLNENSEIATPLPSSTMKLKSAQKTKATPKKAVTPKKVSLRTPGLKKATPLPSKNALVSLTPGFKPIKTPSATPGLKTKTPLSRSAVKFGISNAAQKASTPIPGLKLRSTPGLSLSTTKKIATPIPGLKLTLTPGLSLGSSKKIATPNFSKIHQIAFDKMESIGDYQKRKALNSAKKLKEQCKFHAPSKSNNNKKVAADKIEKMPKTFSGIPFVASKKQTVKRNIQKSSGLKPKPKITTATKSTLNASTLSQKLMKAGNAKAIKSAAKENTPLKQRQKFDLRASLARKLTYKPHTGRIKPLNETKHNGNISTSLPPAKILPTENQVVNNSRMESRDVLRGVRKNKRFLLQMNNRNLSMQQ